MNDTTGVGGLPSHAAAPHDGEQGLFEPHSVTWRLHADPLMGLAALRALLLQALHPVVMDAVDQHSDYRDDPWGRLKRTTEYVGITTYGTATQAMLHGSRVRAVHARIHGRTVDGVEYTADDPQLLAWVHCCFVASFLEIVTRGGGRLSGHEQDAYVREQVRAAMLVGLEPDEVPRDREGLLDYFRVIRPLLQCSPGARRAATLVVEHAERADGAPADGAPTGDLAGGGPAGGARPAWAPVAGLAFAALPPWARRLYALPDVLGAAALPDADTTAALRSLRSALTQSTPSAAAAVAVTGTSARPARP